jgi:hypothetical protein
MLGRLKSASRFSRKRNQTQNQTKRPLNDTISGKVLSFQEPLIIPRRQLRKQNSFANCRALLAAWRLFSRFEMAHCQSPFSSRDLRIDERRRALDWVGRRGRVVKMSDCGEEEIVGVDAKGEEGDVGGDRLMKLLSVPKMPTRIWER